VLLGGFGSGAMRRCGCEGWGEGLESEADCVHDVARQDAGKLGNELCEMGMRAAPGVCATVPIWKPGTRQHAPRDFWG
jgi:hypothetical protein